MSGKGSTQRPKQVSKKEFDDNFDRIFNKGDDMAHKKPSRGERANTHKKNKTKKPSKKSGK